MIEPTPNWGMPYGCVYQMPAPRGRLVWMFRKGQKVRFYDEAGRRVGPEQANVAPAVAYAMSQSWENVDSQTLSLPPVEIQIRVRDLKVGDVVKSYYPTVRNMEVLRAPLPQQSGVMDYQTTYGLHYAEGDRMVTIIVERTES